MARLLDTQLTPALYEVFLSYKNATTVVDRCLAGNLNKKKDTKARLTISDPKRNKQQIYIKSKGVSRRLI